MATPRSCHTDNLGDHALVRLLTVGEGSPADGQSKRHFPEAGKGSQGMAGAVQLTSSPQQNSTEQLGVPRQSLGEPAPAELGQRRWHIKQGSRNVQISPGSAAS